MRCYAFRDISKGKEELFVDHAINVTKCAIDAQDALFRVEDSRVLFTKASRILQVSINTVKEFVIIATLLHDMGKVWTKLQKPCFDRGVCTSFKDHDVMSAHFLLAMGLDLGYIPRDIRLKDLFIAMVLGAPLEAKDDFRQALAYMVIVVFPVLLHNYAIASSKKYSLPYRPPTAEVGVLEACCDDVKALASYLKSHGITGVASYLEKVADEKKLKLMPFDPYTVLKTSAHALEIPTLVEAFIGLLNFCDGRIASARRG
uniref:CRISPR-associated endonuclease Cas3 n=1 Tax=Ignisphaera aggregans TaxID=334771 RepID=A0A7C4BC54_9CREN